MSFVLAMVAVVATIFGIGALTRPFTRERDGRLTVTVVCFAIVAAIAVVMVCGDGR